MTFEFQDDVAAREGASQALRYLHRLAAAGGEGDPLGAEYEALNFFGDRNLQLMLRTVAGGKLRLAPHGFDEFRMLISENHRAPGQLVVDIFVSVHVAQARTAAVLEVERDRALARNGLLT